MEYVNTPYLSPILAVEMIERNLRQKKIIIWYNYFYNGSRENLSHQLPFPFISEGSKFLYINMKGVVAFLAGVVLVKPFTDVMN